jgi:hypothetical protein
MEGKIVSERDFLPNPCYGRRRSYLNIGGWVDQSHSESGSGDRNGKAAVQFIGHFIKRPFIVSGYQQSLSDWDVLLSS